MAVIKKDELLKQAADTIRTLSFQLEEMKKENAKLLKDQHVKELVDHMVDNGMLASEDRMKKVAELAKCSEEEFKVAIKAVSMLSESPTLGRIKHDEVDESSSMDPMTRAIYSHIMGDVE